MPSHFDRFRLLNNPGVEPPRFRNESEKPIQVKATEEDPVTEIPPGQEMVLPVSESGETIIDIPGNVTP
jgi:hypothetical protein